LQNESGSGSPTVREPTGDTDRRAFMGELVEHVEHPILASVVIPDSCTAANEVHFQSYCRR
jgi:hypothetical protein